MSALVRRSDGDGNSCPSELLDVPRNSRLFVVLGKDVGPSEIREHFGPFGDIQDVCMVRDKRTNLPKGVAFVKYARSSQACLAMEKMHGTFLAPNTRPIKVFMATPRDSGNREDLNAEEISQIQVTVPKFFTEEDVQNIFKIYGDIVDCSLVRSKVLRRSKGIAYIKFGKPSQAARAIEECDPYYKAIWDESTSKLSKFSDDTEHAESTKQETKVHELQESSILTSGFIPFLDGPVTRPPESSEPTYYVTPANSSTLELCVSNSTWEMKSNEVQGSDFFTWSKPPESPKHEFNVSDSKPETKSHEIHGSSLLSSVQPPELGSLERTESSSQEPISRRLSVVSQFPFVRNQLFNLFDLIPGLESCEIHQGLYSNLAFAVVQYNNTASAVYAKYKLHGFEYPFGNRLVVTFLEDGSDGIALIKEMALQLVTSQLSSEAWNNNPTLQLLRTSISGSSASSLPPLQTDADLPSRRRKAPLDSCVREKLFLVFDPHPLPQEVLDDVLCRFGHFIKIYLVPGENVGYAMFADRMSASAAIATLHGRTVNGVKLKVMLADLPTEESNKRQRVD